MKLHEGIQNFISSSPSGKSSGKIWLLSVSLFLNTSGPIIPGQKS